MSLTPHVDPDSLPGKVGLSPKEFREPGFFKASLIQSAASLGQIPAIRELPAQLSSEEAVLVDLATGPGGGMIPGLAKQLKQSQFCLGTDINPAVTTGWGHLFHQSRLGQQCTMIETDLTGGLPFQHNSITAFIGAGVGNIDGLRKVLLEGRDCLKPDGFMVFLEWLFPDDSPSARYLQTTFPHIISTQGGFQDACRGEGIELIVSEVIETARGKRSPGDIVPIRDDEEMFLHLVWLRPIRKGRRCLHLM